MKIALGADHAGFAVKSELVKFLKKKGYQVFDFGAAKLDDGDDYPDYAIRVAKAVSSGRCKRGILACGSGLGMAIAANKVKGIRSATVWTPKVAASAALHNWCNVLCVPCRYSGLSKIKAMVQFWLQASFEKGSRHERRVKKIMKIEGVL